MSQRSWKLFEALRAALAVRVHTDRADDIRSGDALNNIAFFDAYFSNCIEGTEFEVEEALDIVFRNQIPQSRSADAHDILGTWRVVSSVEEMSRVPKDFDKFLTLPAAAPQPHHGRSARRGTRRVQGQTQSRRLDPLCQPRPGSRNAAQGL